MMCLPPGVHPSSSLNVFSDLDLGICSTVPANLDCSVNSGLSSQTPHQSPFPSNSLVFGAHPSNTTPCLGLSTTLVNFFPLQPTPRSSPLASLHSSQTPSFQGGTSILLLPLLCLLQLLLLTLYKWFLFWSSSSKNSSSTFYIVSFWQRCHFSLRQQCQFFACLCYSLSLFNAFHSEDLNAKVCA